MDTGAIMKLAFPQTVGKEQRKSLIITHVTSAHPMLTLVHPVVATRLATSLYLTAPELGRLFLLTSCHLQDSLVGHDEDAKPENNLLWRSLCESHWGAEIAQSIALTTEFSFQKIFFTLAFPPIPKKVALPPPLRFKPNDYKLLIEVRQLSPVLTSCTDKEQPGQMRPFSIGRLVFFETIHGQNIPSFFPNGKCDDLVFPRGPFVLPTHEKEDSSSLEVRIHLWRKDGKTIRLVSHLVSLVHQTDTQGQTILPEQLLVLDHYSRFQDPSSVHRLTTSGLLGGRRADFPSKYKVKLGFSLGFKRVMDCSSMKAKSNASPKYLMDNFGLYMKFDTVLHLFDPVYSELIGETGLQFAHFLEAMPDWDQ